MTKFGNQLQQYAQGTDECLHPINQIEDRPDGSVFCRACNTQVRESKTDKQTDFDKFLHFVFELAQEHLGMEQYEVYKGIRHEAKKEYAAQQAEIAELKAAGRAILRRLDNGSDLTNEDVSNFRNVLERLS